MKRVLTIQDISGVGKCSLTEALPIISAAGIECAVLPTTVLSTHTAFEGFTFHDLTEDMPGIADHWAALGLEFSSIYTGYLGSIHQVELVEEIIDRFRKEYAYCVHDIGQYRRIWYPGPGAPDCGAQIHEFLQWLVDRKLEIFAAAQRRGELPEECDVSELVTLIYVFYDGVLDTLETSQRQKGFNRELLEHSDEWFMQIVRSRFGG